VAIIKGKKSGSETLRLMQPLFVRPICLRCHGHQGYKVGDVRGGIGISLPMNSFIKDANRQIAVHAVSLVLLWLIGDFGIISGSSRLKKRTAELARSNLDLQQEIEVRTKAETALQQESSFTAAILNTAAALIVVLDPQGRIIRCNKTCEKLTGYSIEEIRDKKFSDVLLPAAEARQINKHFANIHQQPFPPKLEFHILTKNDQHLAIDCSNTIFTADNGEIEYIISIGIDISDERQLQEQLLHAEKLSAVGKLSASIAHEINNPLFGIRNVLALLLDKGQLNNSNQEFARLAVAECDRIKDLIKNLQDFNRPTSGIMTTVDLTTTIDNMLMLTKKEMKNKGITIKTDYEPDMPPIQAVSDQIKQVLLNLLNNAMESCGPGSRIIISTRKISNQAIIKIADTGNGIPAENLPHIFEPFFTTKAAVKGTGLGLSVSYGIIKRHQGDIKVESKPGQGTVFTITLPITRKSKCTKQFS
jgi:PAS domain S-box-containing protein